MRISTSLIYDRGVASIQDRQSDLFDTQQRLATGRRVLTPADDPLAAAQALQVTQANDINAQFGVNRATAKAQLSLTENSLAQILDTLQAIREQAVAGGNASYTSADRAIVANDVAKSLQQLVGIANSTDAQGQYLFSGYQSTTQPFFQTAGGVQYFGDDGQRLVQAGPARQIAANVSGADAFERVRTGNGTFTWAASAGNSGSGVFGPGSVTNQALLTGHAYQITFTVAAGTTTYDVVDTTSATTVLAAQPYTSGTGSISFDGITLGIEGAPANGDSFSVTPSTDQSLFTTVQNLVNTLNTSQSGAPVANGIGVALVNLDQAIQAVLVQRTEVGTRLREIDSLDSAGENTGLFYQEQRSKLQEVDYAKAARDLPLQQTSLQAAQKSFASITQLSLFNYL